MTKREPINNCRVSVWRVRELVGRSRNPERKTAQDAFVLATSAAEVAEIVDENFLRRVVCIEEFCPISQLPGNKYKVVSIAPPVSVSTP